MRHRHKHAGNLPPAGPERDAFVEAAKSRDARWYYNQSIVFPEKLFELLRDMEDARLVETEDRLHFTAKMRDTTTLSDAEADTLYLASAGLSNAEIAEHKGVGAETVKSQLQRCYVKLKARDRVSAVAAGIRQGLI